MLVCEGVGGLLVPLAPGYLVRDLAADLGYPLVVAASPGLGTINHTLLTIEAARAAGLEVAAVVLTPGPRSRPRSSAPTARRSPPSAGRGPDPPPLDLAEPEAGRPLSRLPLNVGQALTITSR